MKGKQHGGAKSGEAWRTDKMNYLIGRAPDMQHLLQWAESRNVGPDPKPITPTDARRCELHLATGICNAKRHAATE